MFRAVAFEVGGRDLAPGLGIGDRHEPAAVVGLGAEADLILAAARKRAGDRVQGTGGDQAGRPGFRSVAGGSGVGRRDWSG